MNIFKRHFDKKQQRCKKDSGKQQPQQEKVTVEELIRRNEEFVFYYKGQAYEIVCDIGRAIYKCDDSNGKFLQIYHDNEDLIQNGTIEGKKISEILDELY